jgi:nitrous oxidase accessory protein
MIVGILSLITMGSVPSYQANTYQHYSSTISRGDVILVDDDGDGDYTLIQEAVNKSNAGDLIEVYSGTYFEYNIIISHPVTIMGIAHELGGGTDTGKPIIKQYVFLDKIYELIYVISSNVTISNCIFQPYNDTDYNGCGIRLLNSDYCTISDNEFQGMGGGISCMDCPNSIIQNNSIFNADSIGIYIWSSYDSTIRNNTISNIGWNGIDINFDLETPYGCSIIQNHIYNCTEDGIEVEGSGIIITDNVIENCLTGMEIICNSSTFQENLIADCSVGMKIFCQGENTLIENNEIRNNILGMNIDEPDATMVNITRNNFIKNKIQVFYTAINPLLCNTIWNENYWGKSLNHPKPLIGFGILLFSQSEYPVGLPIPWLCLDKYPAQEPYDIKV